VFHHASGIDPFLRQTLIGIVGAQGEAVFRTGCEHPIGLGHTARNQIVDQDADIGLGPVQNDRVFPSAARAAFRPAIRP
jgi:hypothetical protein